MPLRDFPACARSRARRFDPHRFESRLNSFFRAVESPRIPPQLAREIRAEKESIQFECDLRRVDARVEMPGFLCHADRLLERANPFEHRSADRIANRTGPAVEFERCCCEETAAREKTASEVIDPRTAEREPAK